MALVLNRGVNPLLRPLLRSPLHGLASRALLLITYTGRRTGARHTIPVMYAQREAELLILVGHHERKRWWRNLADSAPVDVVLRGRRRHGTAWVLTGEPARGALPAYLARFPRAAGAVGSRADVVMVRVELEPDD